MKRFFMITICCVLFFSPAHSVANTVYFGIDDTIDFSLLEGFDLYVNQPDGPPADLLANFFYQDELNIEGSSLNGAIPTQIAATFPWDTSLATYGAFGFNNGGADNFPLIAGLVCSLTSGSDIAITEVSLTGPAGAYPDPFFVLEQDLNGNILYTASNVPIPSALLLLGGGLIGLLGIRRKFKE